MPAVVFTINLWTPVPTHVLREVEVCVSTASTTQQADSVRHARRDSTGSLVRVSSHLMCAHLVDVRGLGFSLESWIVLRLVHYLEVYFFFYEIRVFGFSSFAEFHTPLEIHCSVSNSVAYISIFS